VTRLFLAEGTVIRKEPLGPDSQRRLRHELAMLKRLRETVGVAQLLEAPSYPGSIVLEDVRGASLAGLSTPLDVDELTELALRMARAVAAIHRLGVTHRDITPANVVISGDGAPCLVDFASATSCAEVRPEFSHHTQIAGTLAYLAPEQTGRTGRAVDQRSDLYALGAILYELATGEPPFGSGDSWRLVHDHLTRVPVPPAEVTPSVPVPLSAIVVHLLEKEPDNRYQTAEGVVYDLERLREVRRLPAAAVSRVGERDFPLRLLPPSRLVGRDDDVAALSAAFEDALAGRCRGVLVSGAPGTGKTVLVDELRSVVTGRDGWFVVGKYDQYRRHLEFKAVHQAFRALGRLLLAEPEDELAEIRGRIVQALGVNAGLMSAAVPEFTAVLAVPPDAGDPLTAQARAQRAGVAVLRAVASRKRPIVFFVDDLQWARPTPLGFIDLVFSEKPIEGLLLVGTYREDDLNAALPLSAPLSRWLEQPDVRRLRLDNLRGPSLVRIVAEMLHLDPAAAAVLAGQIEPYTAGNPYETVELLSALRRDGVLTATGAKWRWDSTALLAHLARSDGAGLVAARVAALPPTTRQVLEAMACLGGRAEPSLLQAATGEPSVLVDQALEPALGEGLLVAESGVREAVRFRHDRLREAIMAGLGLRRRRALHLAMARRLGEAPELFAAAAEQYLPVADAVEDSNERRLVVGLLRRTAEQARLTGDHTQVNALLTAALRLIDPDEIAALIEVRIAWHAALYSMGRLEEADEQYHAINRLRPTALQRAHATFLQVRSLTHRNRSTEALRLGLEALRELAVIVPAPDRLPAELDRQFDVLARWLDNTETADDLSRPEITDPTLLATGGLTYVVLAAAYLNADHATFSWLGLEALRIWREHGPSRSLLGPATIASVAATAPRRDYAIGYRVARRILAWGEAVGHEPETSQARFRFAVLACWFEPIETALREFQRARAGLTRGGDLASAGYTYHPTVAALLDCAPSLDSCLEEVRAGLAFLRRTGSEQIGQVLDSYRWLGGALRGDRPAAADDADPTHTSLGNPQGIFVAHTTRAIAAAIFGDPDDLSRHTEAAMRLLPFVLGLYPVAAAHVLRGLALAGEIRAGHGVERDGLLGELDDVTQWLAARAADAPENFLHLLRLVEAERAWAVGDFRTAVLAFDAARREAAGRSRPWHRALITERAARFLLAHGVEQAGFELLARAREIYLGWGASAKVEQLDWAYPTLRPRPDAIADHRGDEPGDLPESCVEVTTGTLDLLGILSASQALSSQTSIERLQARMVEVLSAVTGATDVHLPLWSEDRQDWLLPTLDGGTTPITGHEHEVPTSVLRYVQRTGEPLVVADATGDDRFARDPYFTDLGCCSLLAVPILSRGSLRAVLLLENRLLRGAFTTERLDAVKLIAGQVAVSLDNAQLYAELTASRARIVAAADQARRRIERDLHDGAQQRLVSLALRLRAAQASMPSDAGELAGQLGSLVNEVTSTLDELRELARGIHPVALAEGGLEPALEALARRGAVPVELEVAVGERLPEQVEIAAYYVVSEALTNVAKHAEASLVQVRVDTVEREGNDLLRVEVRDDGRGGAVAQGSGLLGLKDRVEALGGRIFLSSPPGSGTTLRLELPLTAANGGATFP
jgi:signal transduction histidine kinase